MLNLLHYLPVFAGQSLPFVSPSSDMNIIFQYAPQDTAKLIELQGGVEKFVSRLNFLFDQVRF